MIRIGTVTNRILPILGLPSRLSPQHRQSVIRIKALAAQFRRLDNQKLRDLTGRLNQRARSGRDVLSDEMLLPAFALVREAIRRTLGIEPFDVQLLAGVVLAHGSIAEMQTGEGKTIAAVAPAALHAMRGRGVHVTTVNQYLAGRDFAQLKPVYELLGFSVGLLEQGTSMEARRQAYRCDITYGPGYQFGFDYLHDQISRFNIPRSPLGQRYRETLNGSGAGELPTLQRGNSFVLVDEADSVLIDEARVPLVLSCSAAQTRAAWDPRAYHEAHRLASRLIADRHFLVDKTTGNVSLTEWGQATADAHWRSLGSIALQRPWPIYVEQALKASAVLARDVDYVVQDGSVRVVDQTTGRIFADRTWSDGLHQAVEVKEGLGVRCEQQAVARITRQRYFRLYDTICGMTGTAREAAREFWEMYRLPVVPIPLRRQCRRRILPTRYFANRRGKWNAIADEIERIHKTGQPILVGTRSIEHGEQLAALLSGRAVHVQLLTGKQDESEARVVAKAGRCGTVTIATNMAGRGTDIQLSDKARQLGGLHVIVEEHNDVRRIDRQLAGRAARQGDWGSCQFFVSADDQIIDWGNGSLEKELRVRCDGSGELDRDFARAVQRIQRRIEFENFAQRKALLRQDRWFEELMEMTAPEEECPVSHAQGELR